MRGATLNATCYCHPPRFRAEQHSTEPVGTPTITITTSYSIRVPALRHLFFGFTQFMPACSDSKPSNVQLVAIYVHKNT